MEYFVVLQDYGSGLEAVVDPAVTFSKVIDRIKSREYDNIVQIDWVHVVRGERIVVNMTRELIDAAEAELEEPFGDDLALPAAVIPPVR